MRLAIALVLALCSTASAGRVSVSSQSFIRLDTGLTVVPFAVPVGVAVANVQSPVSLYSYSLGGHAAAESMQSLEERIADRVAAKLLSGTVRASSQPKTLVEQHCAKCHTGEAAKNGFRVDEPLDDAKRLKAIGRVLEDDELKRMPKGGTLPPDVLGKLIQELSRK